MEVRNGDSVSKLWDLLMEFKLFIYDRVYSIMCADVGQLAIRRCGQLAEFIGVGLAFVLLMVFVYIAFRVGFYLRR